MPNTLQRCFWIIVLALLAACNMIPPSPTAASAPTFTAIPSTVSNVPTETLAPPATPTIAPETGVKVNCLEVKPSPKQANLNGVLALVPDNGGPMYQGFFLDLKTGEKNLLRGGETQTLSSASVSPNRRLLAYFLTTEKPNTARLVIMGMTGVSTLDRLVSGGDWFNMVGWVDDKQLMFSKYKLNSDGNYLVRPLNAILYNPFAQEQKELPSDFPGIWTLESPRWDEFSLTEASYDPSFSYVVYPQNGSRLVLWDLRQRRQVVAFDTNTFFGSAPRWSPDGQKFLTHNSIVLNKAGATDNTRQELYSIDTAGEVQQLTRLTTFYGRAQITKYSWSPDGRLVAFWVRTEPDNYAGSSSNANRPFRLAVLDLQTQVVTNYCLSGDVTTLNPKGGLISYSPNTPIWSPDGSSLLIHAPNGDKNGMTVLVDIGQGLAIQVAEDMLPIGWLVNDGE